MNQGPVSCFAILIWEELPEGWDELPFEEKFDADQTATGRAQERWRATHPNFRHDAEKWANR